MLDGIGPHRPAPAPGPALVAVAAALIGGAALTLIGLGLDSERGTLVLGGLVVAIGGVALAFANPHLVTAASVLAGLGVPVLVIGAFSSSVVEHPTLVLVVMTLAELAVFLAVPKVRGRPFVLGVTLVLAASTFISIVTSSGTDGYYDEFGDEDPTLAIDRVFASTRSVVYAALIIGALYLFVAMGLDRIGRSALATPFIAIGALSSVTNVWTLDVFEDTKPAAVMVVAVGVLLVAVGTRGGRRASQWIGAAQIGGGLVYFASSIDSAAGAAWCVLLLGAALGGAGVFVATRSAP